MSLHFVWSFYIKIMLSKEIISGNSADRGLRMRRSKKMFRWPICDFLYMILSFQVDHIRCSLHCLYIVWRTQINLGLGHRHIGAWLSKIKLLQMQTWKLFHSRIIYISLCTSLLDLLSVCYRYKCLKCITKGEFLPRSN